LNDIEGILNALHVLSDHVKLCELSTCTLDLNYSDQLFLDMVDWVGASGVNMY